MRTEKCTPIVEGVRNIDTGNESHSLNGYEPGDANSASSSLSTLVTSEEVARLIKAATDPPKKQLERLCDLMK